MTGLMTFYFTLTANVCQACHFFNSKSQVNVDYGTLPGGEDVYQATRIDDRFLLPSSL